MEDREPRETEAKYPQWFDLGSNGDACLSLYNTYHAYLYTTHTSNQTPTLVASPITQKVIPRQEIKDKKREMKSLTCFVELIQKLRVFVGGR